MAKLVRYTTSQHCPPTAPDWDSDVRHGDFESLPDAARLLPPCSPTKIVCIGRNYVDHAKELGNEVPSEPLIFLKPPSSLVAHGDAIVYPSISQNVHFEGELGVIIGKAAKHVNRENAME